MVVSVDMAEVVFDDDDEEQGEDLFVCVLRFPLSRGRPMGPGMAGTHHAPVRPPQPSGNPVEPHAMLPPNMMDTGVCERARVGIRSSEPDNRAAAATAHG